MANFGYGTQQRHCYKTSNNLPGNFRITITTTPKHQLIPPSMLQLRPPSTLQKRLRLMSLSKPTLQRLLPQLMHRLRPLSKLQSPLHIMHQLNPLFTHSQRHRSLLHKVVWRNVNHTASRSARKGPA